MSTQYSEKNYLKLIEKLLNLEQKCDEQNVKHAYVTRKRIALINSWNIYAEQFNSAEEFLEDYENN